MATATQTTTTASDEACREAILARLECDGREYLPLAFAVRSSGFPAATFDRVYDALKAEGRITCTDGVVTLVPQGRHPEADRFLDALACHRGAKKHEAQAWDDLNRAKLALNRRPDDDTRRNFNEAGVRASAAWLDRKRCLWRVVDTLRRAGGVIVLDGWRYEVTPNGGDFFESQAH